MNNYQQEQKEYKHSGDFYQHESNGFNQHESNGFNQYNGGDFEYARENYDEQQLIRPFYEQIWFIVCSLIMFWPAGIILAIWRFIRDKEIAAFDPNQTTPPLSQMFTEDEAEDQPQEQPQVQKKKKSKARAKIEAMRSCRGLKMGGWALIALGIIDLFGLTEAATTAGLYVTLASGIGFALAGAIMLLAARRTVRKWDRYESYINKKGNTWIPWLARKMEMPEKNVRVDVQSMINKGFFDKPSKGISAYINGEYDQIVMTKYGVPMQPIKKPREADNVPANSYIAKLRDEMDRTTDEELLETLRTMESSIKRIEAKIEEEPKLKDMTNIRKLKETYLPQTLELIKKFNDGEGSDEMRWEIKAMLGTCAKAFKNIETKVYEKEDIDTKVDMEVLRKTLEREGLLGSDFNIQS